MGFPQISVIVPVYKAEAYLHRCVDSLLAQTFKDFEILLVDDGSPDASGQICDEYAQRDNRVRVLHKENGGVSSARQCGLDNARGEYVIHADPDDWAEPTMLEELYAKAKADDADMVICDYYANYQQREVYIRQRPSASLNHDAVLKDLFQQLHGSCWNKLTRRACYSLYDVRFPEGLNICEDFFVCVQLLRRPIRVSYVAKAFYHYDQTTNQQSISRHMLPNHVKQDEKIIALIAKVLPEDAYSRQRNTLTGNALLHILRITADSGAQFKQKYGSYRNCVLNSDLSRGKKAVLYLACGGYLTLIRQLFRLRQLFSRRAS